MFKIQVFDNYPQASLDHFNATHYQLGTNLDSPDVILVRSHQLHDHAFSEPLKAVGRAGTGIDNIPVNDLTRKGIPVFYAPGANANAVKELVLAAILMSYRNLSPALTFIDELKQSNPDELHKQIEQNKKAFVGQEITGKTLGIIGLGNIGVKVANMAHSLGMKVIAFDPGMSIPNALALMPDVTQAHDMNQVLSSADAITLHLPLIEDTTGMINHATLKHMKKDAILLNFSRGGIVDEKALIELLDHQQIKAYITDFPSKALLKRKNVLCFPHLGASTVEAQQNASQMVIHNMKNFLELGTIEFSANFPTTQISKPDNFTGYRLVITNRNQPGVIAEISNAIVSSNLNIERMVNTSNHDIAFNLVDITGSEKTLDQLIQDIKNSSNILNIRYIVFK